MGKTGIKEVAQQCAQKSHYTMEKITEINGFELKYQAPFFKEFVVKTPLLAQEITTGLLRKNVLAGVDLSRFNPQLKNCLLICVTEKRTKKEIDYFVDELKGLT